MMIVVTDWMFASMHAEFKTFPGCCQTVPYDKCTHTFFACIVTNHAKKLIRDVIGMVDDDRGDGLDVRFLICW